MTFLQLFLIEMDIKIGTGSSFCPPVFQAGIQNEACRLLPDDSPFFPFLQIHITGKKEIQDIFFQLTPDMDMGRLHMNLIGVFYDGRQELPIL